MEGRSAPLLPLPSASRVDIERAAEQIRGSVVRTPLIHLPGTSNPRVFLKLENLQPIGSFKLRGATAAMARLSEADLAGGVYTASAGNMAQGVAWNARRIGVPCRVIVPEGAPRTKLEAIARLGAEAVARPFAEWWQVMLDHRHPDFSGRFVHPFADPGVLAGNGTIGLEILEDLPDVEAVVAPFGGGGLACGIACALREAAPAVPVYAAEVATATPLAAAWEAGEPVQVDWVPSFVDGIGSRGVSPQVWPLARTVLAGVHAAPLDEVEAVVRLLAERARIVAEGAAATAVAVARSGAAGRGDVVAVVSGGNIDTAVLAALLGQTAVIHSA